LELRARSGGRVSLDAFMRALWERHGRARAGGVGAVERPYTQEDVKGVLAELSGDPAFAHEFFARFIEGREAVDYTTLLAHAGMLLRPADPGRAFAGTLRLRDTEGGPRIAAATPFGSPAYEAGLDRDDVIVSI